MRGADVNARFLNAWIGRPILSLLFFSFDEHNCLHGVTCLNAKIGIKLLLVNSNTVARDGISFQTNCMWGIRHVPFLCHWQMGPTSRIMSPAA